MSLVFVGWDFGVGFGFGLVRIGMERMSAGEYCLHYEAGY